MSSEGLSFWLEQLIRRLETEPLTASREVPPSADELERLEMWRQRAVAEYDPSNDEQQDLQFFAIETYHALKSAMETKSKGVQHLLNRKLINALLQVACLSGQRWGESPVNIRLKEHQPSGHPRLWRLNASGIEEYDDARACDGQTGWFPCLSDEWRQAEIASVATWSPIQGEFSYHRPEDEDLTGSVLQALRETLAAAEQLPMEDNGTGEALPTEAKTKDSKTKQKRDGSIREKVRQYFRADSRRLLETQCRVAELLGVSEGTVSYVYNEPEFVAAPRSLTKSAQPVQTMADLAMAADDRELPPDEKIDLDDLMQTLAAKAPDIHAEMLNMPPAKAKQLLDLSNPQGRLSREKWVDKFLRESLVNRAH